jgi:D-alanyl-lipoteichoic acid acyltransferase DltB (MBOAT superfamily)
LLFNSLSFLVFLAVVLGISRLGITWRLRKAILLVMSYLFYAAWNPPFVVLLWLSTIADWYFAKWIAGSSKPHVRHGCLIGSLLVNLGLLGFFKYSMFVMGNVQSLAAMMGHTLPMPAMDIILPVGISFYTFQTLSYTLDVYRGDAKPWHSFLDYALYVTFFPQLVAGPIVRATDFLPQCVEDKPASWHQISWGLVLVVVGLFNKMFIADTLMAPIVQKVYNPEVVWGLIVAWGGTMAFAVQIFCDFAGYSTCAIGVALMLGFELPDNFRFPYAALGFSDFWRRWHISLSTWLRDYLYISLGGNRKGKFNTYRNLMFTMLLGGLWHGASWNFVAWGGLHGGYLVGERLIKKVVPEHRFWQLPATKLLLIMLTFAAVCFAWVYFRAPDFAMASGICKGMLGFNGIMAGFGDVFTRLSAARTYAVVGVCLLLHLWLRDHSLESTVRHVPMPVLSVMLGVMMLVVFLSMFGEDHAFIYFQF